MGIQIIIKSNDLGRIRAALNRFAPGCEVFPIDDDSCGVSIPSQVLEAHGEPALQVTLAAFEYFDLWAGRWQKPKTIL
ncbi:hypothetical protein [Pseudomonas sp. MF4836]|uniref:hypothetical protein n=1 Tax=Pseudomonas sp. MF4836 TaxID=1960827 RepID=UPI000997A984|nr:hypothetical protein [Pseudomonas sp. MF4836]OOW00651.1 hypothetical protein MF4836_01700 [Pseudomonas sp. MF4836]